ncbi:ArnT family glycosyltransferase [Flagellimonas zhangzhouensis]|uniref:Dolichyl-phosphate-mannose-protein mannosyltransferase n=1 Tax=Flagellimonas zhangzhouensis TaxID=1073328 RepID=A0A1H2VAN5_9FLAO|nr:glycosyltransferase family 39 protein [Allomuricauda zhangzhouensis]SDQ09383.1 Dolichyl-phosphate-mannose-protein mannosyltransferase [Allomuricauda zhangzhouensis]SDW65355.1 Dolichyl-phosphate-mannose-protein mannosyltransferase [Allomuricauda zhangzhouensis]
MGKTIQRNVLKKFPFPNYKNLDWKTVFLILFVVALIIRFPFFFRDYVDRDESTFIIMGQSWANGFLPYTQLWDLKPPVTFLFFAIIIKIFGKSFIAIRFFGSLLVALTSMFTYSIASKISSKKIAFWVALFCVCFQSLFGSLQGVMSEHICTFFFVAGLFILFLKDDSKWYFTTGLLFGLSVMTKLNMVYPVLSLGIYFLWEGFYKKQLRTTLKNLVFMGIGFVFTIALTALPYYLQGNLQIWWASIFEAPLAYSEGKFHSPLKTLPFLVIILGLLVTGFRLKIIDWKSRPLQILTVIILGVLISFMQTGKVNGHYLIQLYPFILIPIGIAISKLPELSKKYRPIVVILLFLIPMESYLEYANIISNKLEKGTFFNGEGFTVPQYILENHLETKNIFFTEYHIGYWVLGVSPPTKVATHPSNITREELFPYMQNPRETGLEELHYIMEIVKPKILVAREGKEIFDKKLLDFNAYIDNYLKDNYTLIATVDRGLIYQRLE